MVRIMFTVVSLKDNKEKALVKGRKYSVLCGDSSLNHLIIRNDKRDEVYVKPDVDVVVLDKCLKDVDNDTFLQTYIQISSAIKAHGGNVNAINQSLRTMSAMELIKTMAENNLSVKAN